MRIYRQKGYTIKASVDKVGDTPDKTFQVLTMLFKKGTQVSKYVIASNVGGKIRYTHIKKLLTDVGFRNKYIVEGYEKCEEVFSYHNAKGVTLDCAKAVRDFNKLENPTLEDYSKLKTYGNDDFSELFLEELVPQLKNKAKLEEIQKVFKDTERITSVCRWILRGLSVQHAIQRELISISNDNQFRDNFVKKHLDTNLSKELETKYGKSKSVTR